MFDPPFPIGHLYKGEQDRIRAGELNPTEREMLARNEDPWSKFRKPKDDSEPESSPETIKGESHIPGMGVSNPEIYPKGNVADTRGWEPGDPLDVPASKTPLNCIEQPQKPFDGIFKDIPPDQHLQESLPKKPTLTDEEISEMARRLEIERGFKQFESITGEGGMVQASAAPPESDDDDLPYDTKPNIYPVAIRVQDSISPATDQMASTGDKPWHKHRDLVVGILLACG